MENRTDEGVQPPCRTERTGAGQRSMTSGLKVLS